MIQYSRQHIYKKKKTINAEFILKATLSQEYSVLNGNIWVNHGGLMHINQRTIMWWEEGHAGIYLTELKSTPRRQKNRKEEDFNEKANWAH